MEKYDWNDYDGDGKWNFWYASFVNCRSALLKVKSVYIYYSYEYGDIQLSGVTVQQPGSQKRFSALKSIWPQHKRPNPTLQESLYTDVLKQSWFSWSLTLRCFREKAFKGKKSNSSTVPLLFHQHLQNVWLFKYPASFGGTDQGDGDSSGWTRKQHKLTSLRNNISVCTIRHKNPLVFGTTVEVKLQIQLWENCSLRCYRGSFFWTFRSKEGGCSSGAEGVETPALQVQTWRKQRRSDLMSQLDYLSATRATGCWAT